MRIEVDGSELWYEVTGAGGPMVLLPGGPGFAHDYLRPHLDPLAEDRTLVWLDLPGAGRSLIDGGVASITHRRWIESLEALRDHLGFDAWGVFGHSYGGFVAAEYALSHPDSVTALVLCSTASSGAHLATLLDRLPPALAAADRRLVARLLTGEVPDQELEARMRDVVRLFFSHEQPAAIVETFHVQPSTFRHVIGTCLPTLDIERRLGALAPPVLLIAGADDWQLTPEVSRSLARDIPGAELAWITGAGHYPFIDDPDGVVRAVRQWLHRKASTSATR